MLRGPEAHRHALPGSREREEQGRECDPAHHAHGDGATFGAGRDGPPDVRVQGAHRLRPERDLVWAGGQPAFDERGADVTSTAVERLPHGPKVPDPRAEDRSQGVPGDIGVSVDGSDEPVRPGSGLCSAPRGEHEHAPGPARERRLGLQAVQARAE